MLNKILRFTFIVAIISMGYCYAFSADNKPVITRKTPADQIVITSEILTADNKENVAIFEKSVVAKKGDMTLYADKMQVYSSTKLLDDKSRGTSTSNIDKIEADGNVKFKKNNRIITSKKAIYFTKPEEMVEFTGEPVASDGSNVVTGTKILYYISDDRYKVENSKVFLIDKKGVNSK